MAFCCAGSLLTEIQDGTILDAFVTYTVNDVLVVNSTLIIEEGVVVEMGSGACKFSDLLICSKLTSPSYSCYREWLDTSKWY